VLPYPGHPRTWPADYWDEFQFVDEQLRTAEQNLEDALEED
jgi:hypothetical protein